MNRLIYTINIHIWKKKEEEKENGRGKRKEVKEELRLETKMCPLPNQAYHQEPSI